jgi:type IV pilus assembly protein PilN
MRITINLATRPFADLGPILKRLRTAMIAFAVVSVALGVGLYLLHQKAEQARARNHSLDGDIAHITHERQGYESMMRQPGNALVLNEAGFLNQLFEEKAFSWTLAMEDLETVLPRGVQVTTLEPLRDKEGRITLRLRVVGPRNADVGLLQNLERSKFFLHPTIVGESLENNGGPGEKLEPVSESNKVNFDLLAEYNAEALAVPPPAPKTEEKSTAAPQSPVTGAAHSAAGPGTAVPHPAGPAANPGLRRPPMTGVSQPPTGPAQPPAGAPQSNAALRQSGVHRNPAVPPSNAAPKANPGGPQ